MRGIGLLAVLVALLGEAHAFTVTTVDAEGSGSLAQAIIDANAMAGPDTITFAIPPGDPPAVPNISTAQLPEVTDPVTIDGTTQPGGLVELTALTSLSGTGLRLRAGASTVRGLVINRWNRAIEISGPGGNVIEGNRIGTDVLGLQGRANVEGVVIVGSPDNRIGGTTDGARNLISGNTDVSQQIPESGIRIEGEGASGNVIEGNRIGSTAAGTSALRNQIGIRLLAGASATRVGGTAAGAGNLIVANGTGIALGPDAADTVIEGNLIGVAPNGTGALGNVSEGIQVTGAKRTRIGGATAGARNVISGNGNGVELDNLSEDTVIEGNYIGTDATGTLDLGNSIGVFLTGSLGTRIVANTISGNLNGVNASLLAVGSDLRIEGNRIGTNAAGTAAVANNTGILLSSGTAVTIGGGAPAAGNLISGNSNVGVSVGATATGITIEQNRIGTAADGATALGNGTAGVQLAGGLNTVRNNVIAWNGGAGIALPSGSGSGNALRTNSIFDNGGLGIDLGIAGVTPNDTGDADNGPNTLQNFPVLDRPLIGGSSLGGTLRSIKDTTYTIDIFVNAACDSTQHGEGRELLATVSATTSSGGLASFTTTVGRTFSTEILTATATDPGGNTSEFSACVTPAVFVTTTTLDPTTTSVTTTSSTTTTSATTADSTSTTSSSTTVTLDSTSSTASTTSSPSSSSSSTSTTSLTTSTAPSVPTTTIPLPLGCALVPDAPTFPSLRCRLDALRARTEDEAALDSARVRLLAALGKATAREVQAEDSCLDGRTRAPKVRIAQMRRHLARYRRRLRALARRHDEMAAIVGPLADAAADVRADARALRRSLSCPEAVSSPTPGGLP
jgi:hypothetical protein